MTDYEVTADDKTFAVSVQEAGTGLMLTVDGLTHTVVLSPWVEPTHFILDVDGEAASVTVRKDGEDLRIGIRSDEYRLRVGRRIPISRRARGGASEAAEVRMEAPMPGLIIAVPATVGSVVTSGTPVVIIEAMKMQMEIYAPRAGRIKTIAIQPGQEVAKGQTLVTIASTQSIPSTQSPQSA